jgi:diguanylate cyclase (GGDEF)-like protein
MTVEVEQTSGRTGSRRDVSGAVVNVLIGLVHALRGDGGVAQTLALAGERRPFTELADLSARSTVAESVALFNAAALVTGDGTVGLHVGEALLTRPDLTGFVDRIVALGAPDVVMKHVGALVAHFETASKAAPLEVAEDHALVLVAPRGPEPRHAHLCEMTRGLLSQVPVLFGSGPGLITETECSARGGRHCLYAVSWDTGFDPDPDPDEEGGTPDDRPEPAPPSNVHPLRPGSVATFESFDGGPGPGDRLDRPHQAERDVVQLRAELDRMGALIEGAFATSLEILGDDLESLLSEIAARADAVVTGRRYLLMVKVRPATPVQLHYRGLDADEAQRLAGELWRQDPEDAGGTRIIVDITSGRRSYGRLVELLDPVATRPATEAKMLRLYAEYAATALDVFGVLSDAKRSDATARTLLSFSESLSGLTNVADLVQVLADTVPDVTDCDNSSVYLWEAGLGQLVPRARTAGYVRPEADLGPIVPIHRSDPSSGRARPGRPVREGKGAAPDDETADFLRVPSDLDMIDRIMGHKQVVVLDSSTDDPVLRSLMERSNTDASVVASLFAAGEFLGVVSANFHADTPVASIRDPDLHERLSGLADQAATALQNLDLLEKVSHLAWHDALTGLPNRRLFEDRVEQELIRSRRVGEPVCMFFVDLDHFKTVNDTLGHAAGDDLIQQVSERLVDTVRRQDTVARVGGDEFAILLPGLSDQLSIDELAQRSLEAMSMPFTIFGQEVETSASVGIAMAPDHGDSYDLLLSRADEAMYRAKSRGRNAFQMYSDSPIDPVDGHRIIDERTLYSDLVHALAHDEFFVLYQPYIDLRTARVVGVEALVRWEHPSLGTLEPASFISLAERSQVIVALDAWVLEEACRQARLWLDRGLDPLRISVNLATRDLSHPDLFENVQQTLEDAGIEPSTLELEITERVVLDRSGPARDNIDRLRRLGVRFTIDDFGTGNSSLNRIGSFPVSTLKIDQSFVQVLGPDGDNNSLVSAIISMADRLGLDCIAEGVETSVQSRVLLQRGCTTAQGYYFSPPLPAEDIEELMERIAAGDGSVIFGDDPS